MESLVSRLFCDPSDAGQTRIAWSRGTQSQGHARRSTRNGAIAGAIIGGIIGDQNNEALAGAAIGGLVGAAAGRAVGNSRYYGTSYGYPRTVHYGGFGNYNYNNGYRPVAPVYRNYGYGGYGRSYYGGGGWGGGYCPNRGW